VNDARLSSLNYKKLQFWPLNDQIKVSFVRAAGVLAKGRMRPAGRMCDMPVLQDGQSPREEDCICKCHYQTRDTEINWTFKCVEV
jgi:hypothetical protein